MDNRNNGKRFWVYVYQIQLASKQKGNQSQGGDRIIFEFINIIWLFLAIGSNKWIYKLITYLMVVILPKQIFILNLLSFGFQSNIYLHFYY